MSVHFHCPHNPAKPPEFTSYVDRYSSLFFVLSASSHFPTICSPQAGKWIIYKSKSYHRMDAFASFKDFLMQ